MGNEPNTRSCSCSDPGRLLGNEDGRGVADINPIEDELKESYNRVVWQMRPDRNLDPEGHRVCERVPWVRKKM